MSEKRFTGKMLVATNGEEFGFTIYDEDKRMSIDEVVELLNEQQATIEELERKVKKYAKIGEEQLKQIIDLQDKQLEKTKGEKNCGHCKHFQIDGMFGLWCEKGYDWTLVDEYCSDFER